MSGDAVLNLSCPICKLVFVNSDAIYSTSCGHIFHFACLNSWKAQSTTCPQCREYNPSTHRVFLNFDLVPKTSNVELEQKIVTLEKSVLNKRMDYQKLRSDTDKFRKLTDDRIQSLSKTIFKKQEDNQKLQNLLKEANEVLAKEKEMSDKLSNENRDLKSMLESKDGGAIISILESKNNVLEQRLKFITEELQKEVAKSTQLSIDRMKLQSFQDLMGAANAKMDAANAKPKQQNPKTNKTPKQKKFEFASNKTIIIKKLPQEKLEYPSENIIVSLAEKMKIVLPKEKIVKVDIKPSTETNMVTLWVQFKEEATKLSFLMCKDLLQCDDILKSLEITEFDEGNIRSLFTYANRKLRGKVFNFIALKSNGIVCKKNLFDKEEIIIKDRSHVDELLRASRVVSQI